MLSIERLSLEDAEVLIEGATQKANELGIPMCIAVADESGNLIAFNRMDGGKILSTQLAQDKAFAAAASRKTTAAYCESSVPGKLGYGIQSAWNGRFSTVGGGVPVEIDGVIVGAIGVSGGMPEQDIECCEAAIEYFNAG